MGLFHLSVTEEEINTVLLKHAKYRIYSIESGRLFEVGAYKFSPFSASGKLILQQNNK